MSTTFDRWQDALMAAQLLVVAPRGLRGIVVRARIGPARDAWWRTYAGLTRDLADPLRLPGTALPEDLRDGLDLSATLASGRQTLRRGLLTRARGGSLIIPMAERMGPALAAELGQHLDRPDAATLVAWDEGAEPDEGCPAALIDRLGLCISLDGLSRADTDTLDTDPSHVAGAQALLPAVVTDDATVAQIVTLSLTLGISSQRAPLMALSAARAAAALDGRTAIDGEDIALALRLVLLPRACQLPQDAPKETEAEAPPPEPKNQTDTPSPEDGPEPIPEDAILEAARATLPPDLLARLLTGQTSRTAAGGAGAGEDRISLTRGRPLGAIRGGLHRGARLDLIATLRAAAAWQGIRPRHAGQRLAILPQDIRLKRFREPRESALIFIVDASGSSARGRLAETKGAIELMLAEAYARREDVALIAFRGVGADLLLPPTRSLLQANRRLSGLPGGGGTPLAAGLRSGAELAERVRRAGTTPYLVVLTDGRGNVGLDGNPGRGAATEDARRVARAIAGEGLPSLLIDTANRPQRAAETLASDLGGRYVALPRANAAEMSALVRSTRDAA